MFNTQRPRRTALILTIAATAAIATLPSRAADESYPTKAITLISSVTAGSGADAVARILGEGISREFKQPVLINNKPGGNGLVAVRALQAVPADGYTFAFGTSGLAIETAMKKSAFDLRKELVPVARVVQGPLGLFVSNKVPANTVQELLDYAGRNPGKLNYATLGVGSAAHLATARLLHATNRDMVHVPYPSGGPQIITAMIAGDADVFITELSVMKPFVSDRKLKLLATLSGERSPMYPDVPSISEAGVPQLRNFDASFFMAIFASPGTPPDRVEAMNRAVNKVLAEPATREQLATRGYRPAEFGGMNVNQVGTMVGDFLTGVERIVRDAKISTGS